MFGFDFTEVSTWGVPLGFLLLADVILGAAAAFKGGTFKPSWLYLFATTKGLAFFIGEALLVVSAIAPDLSIPNGPEVPADFFATMGIGFLAPLGLSVLASIAGNVNQLRLVGDVTPPTGAPAPPIGDIEIGEVEETPPTP